MQYSTTFKHAYIYSFIAALAWPAFTTLHARRLNWFILFYQSEARKKVLTLYD